MCGIVGICDFSKLSSGADLTRMADHLKHRGPDASGFFEEKTDAYFLGLGHRRLSILDLNKRSDQPMVFDNMAVSYNGEIYNFQDIRDQLIDRGYTFETTSDTEVVLKAYHCWGDGVINKFNGMFAFAIYDSRRKEIVLIRDRAGVKPLYYYYQNGLFLFSSELKSLILHPGFSKELDLDSLGLYLNLGYVPSPYSIFQNTFKLLPGSILKFSVDNGAFETFNYWKVEDFYNQPKFDSSLEEILEEVEALLTDSLKIRLISDVPIGLFLSGGYDSSLLAALLSKKIGIAINAYTVAFSKEEFNEANHARLVAEHLGVEHRVFQLSENKAKEIFADFANIYDEPFGDTSGIPTIFLSSKLQEDGVKVILTGDGAEETFAGYNIYLKGNSKMELLEKAPSLFRKLALSYYSNSQRDRERYPFNKFNFLNLYFGKEGGRNNQSFQQTLLNKKIQVKPNYFELYRQINGENTFLDRRLATDFRTRLLDDFLCKIDRGTMSQSIEAREPFLDFRLMEFLARVPMRLRCHNGMTKYLIKAITHRYLPSELMNRPKMGFAIPLDFWLRGELRYLIEEHLDENKLKRQGIFNVSAVKELCKKFLEERVTPKERNRFIYTLLFQMWYDNWFE